jgi:hypothetical protein
MRAVLRHESSLGIRGGIPYMRRDVVLVAKQVR